MSEPIFVQDTILGQKVTEARRQLDVFELPGSISSVIYSSDEVTSNCPITGQPDFYMVDIQLSGAGVGIESKSLKLYLQSFRDDGQFCEAFADTIAQDVYQATRATLVRVDIKQKPRGGVSIDATAMLVDGSAG